MKQNLIPISVLALALLGAGAPQTKAVIILGNTTFQEGGVNVEGRAGQDKIGYAAGFTMPAQSYSLTDVVLGLGLYSGPSDAIISIYSDVAGLPGSPIALALLDPPAGAFFTTYTFLPSAPTILAANTSYWLVVAAETEGNYLWLDSLENPTGVANFDGYAQSVNDAWADFVFTPLRFTINGDLATVGVPEGGETAMLLGLGLLVLILGKQTRLSIRRS